MTTPPPYGNPYPPQQPDGRQQPRPHGYAPQQHYGQQSAPPPYGYPPQQVHVANQHTRTVHGPGCLMTCVHATMTLMTLGLWYPIWRRAKRTSRHY
ncbi:hypothetical protein [Streptomyces xanthophaeus]